MMKPFLEESSHHITCYLNDSVSVRLPKYDMEKLYQLLFAHYCKRCELNKSTWNGAIAVMEDGWPKFIEQHGSYTSALHRAKRIHEDQKSPTIAYALIGAYGIIQEDIQGMEDECSTCQTPSQIQTSKMIATLEDFL